MLMGVFSSKHSNNTDLRLFVSLNLAITYMKIGEAKDAEVSLMAPSCLVRTCSLHTHACTHTHTHTYTHTHTRMHTHIHTYTHTRTHIHTHACTHTHTYTHTHTHTHTHTQLHALMQSHGTDTLTNSRYVGLSTDTHHLSFLLLSPCSPAVRV